MNVRVALAGCGVVGAGFVRLLQRHRRTIAARHGVSLEVVRVLVRDPERPREAGLPRRVFTDRPVDLLNAGPHLVVEALGGLEPAGAVARQTLESGRSYVTANKALVAKRGPELAGLAQAHGGRLAFEAAVGGGVPVVRVLRDALAHTGVRQIRGILNGTTNFILGRMHQGLSFQEALARAQAQGFAEADPTRDLDGNDAADKIRILAWLAFGCDPDTLLVRTRGLLPDPEGLVARARSRNGVLRLVARCGVRGGQVQAAVAPVVVPGDSRLARVTDEENLMAITTAASGVIRLSGPGAGGEPTASALLADVVECAAELLRPRGLGGPAGSDHGHEAQRGAPGVQSDGASPIHRPNGESPGLQPL